MRLVGEMLKVAAVWSGSVCKRWAGHSKWANIRHTKTANDLARSKVFMKYTQQIKICIQDTNDANPETNRSLASIIEYAKRNSMPVSTIQNAIKNSQGNKNRSEEHWFEIKGPRGSFIIASVITDNKKRTKDTMAQILKKSNATFVDNIARVMFDRKGIIEAEAPGAVTDMDQVLEHAIESMAEDVTPTDSNTYEFFSDPVNLEKTKKKLEELGYKILEAENHFLPNNQVNLTDVELASIEKLCDKLMEHPDVVKLYDNIA